MGFRTLLLGLLLAVLAVGVWVLTALFELGSMNSLVAVVAGVVLALVRDRSPLARYGAFLIGLVLGVLVLVLGMAGWIGWLVAIVLFTIISGLTGGRLPLWAMILGGGAFAAIYEPYLETAWFVLTQLPSSLLMALAASSGGFVAAVFVELLAERKEVAAELAEFKAEHTTPLEQTGASQ